MPGRETCGDICVQILYVSFQLVGGKSSNTGWIDSQDGFFESVPTYLRTNPNRNTDLAISSHLSEIYRGRIMVVQGLEAGDAKRRAVSALSFLLI